jgi:hypothetical protein
MNGGWRSHRCFLRLLATQRVDQGARVRLPSFRWRFNSLARGRPQDHTLASLRTIQEIAREGAVRSGAGDPLHVFTSQRRGFLKTKRDQRSDYQNPLSIVKL